MPKQEEPLNQPIQLVLRLTAKITTKLTALGYSHRETHEHLFNIINPILKTKTTHFKSLQKWLAQRLEKDEHTKKTICKLAAELELYLNSIHDNYDSDSDLEPAFLKFQHLVAAEPTSKVADSQDKRHEARHRYINPSERRQARKERRQLVGEDYFDEMYRRRYIEKANRRKEVKLEYLSTLNY